MAGLFRRRKQDRGTTVEPENRHDPRLDELYAKMVPASARAPETQRFARQDDADPDAPDEDLAFLASLASEVDRAPSPSPRVQARPDAVRTVTLPAEEEKLNVFREMKDAPVSDRDAMADRVEQVDLDDILETLSTTAAALRLRKAA